MNECREEYAASVLVDRTHALSEANVVPRRWLKFIHRVARFEAGKAYTITMFMPKQRDAEAVWTVHELGSIENQR